MLFFAEPLLKHQVSLQESDPVLYLVVMVKESLSIAMSFCSKNGPALPGSTGDQQQDHGSSHFVGLHESTTHSLCKSGPWHVSVTLPFKAQSVCLHHGINEIALLRRLTGLQKERLSVEFV